jgi:hypothetical protein
VPAWQQPLLINRNECWQARMQGAFTAPQPESGGNKPHTWQPMLTHCTADTAHSLIG